MINIHRNFDLKEKTTWHISVISDGYCKISTKEELEELVKSEDYKTFKKFHILGKGANTLFAKPRYDGLVIEMDMKGKVKLSESDKEEVWEIMAGEDWIELVEFFISKELGGLENLAFIPGKVGAAPVQNIAAYGKAFEEVCESVKVLVLSTGIYREYSKSECSFGYRSSRFKMQTPNENRDEIIVSVSVRVSKHPFHKLENSYYSISEKMADVMKMSGKKESLKTAFDTVVALRKSKLPDIALVGTNGSLFMNPIISGIHLKKLLLSFPKLQYYPTQKMEYLKSDEISTGQIQDGRDYKIAAGHIFDTLGWKGKRIGRVGTWDKHALVLCSYGATDPKEILDFIELMKNDFEKATGIIITPEINIIY